MRLKRRGAAAAGQGWCSGTRRSSAAPASVRSYGPCWFRSACWSSGTRSPTADGSVRSTCPHPEAGRSLQYRVPLPGRQEGSLRRRRVRGDLGQHPDGAARVGDRYPSGPGGRSRFRVQPLDARPAGVQPRRHPAHPLLALLPLFLLWFGSDPSTGVALIAFGVFLILTIQVTEAVRNVPHIYVRASLTAGPRASTSIGRSWFRPSCRT